MTPPKHPLDGDLKAYIDSVPPPTELDVLQKKVEDRLDTPTGVHDLNELKKAHTKLIVQRVEDKYEEEREGRIKAEAKVNSIIKWAAVTVSGIVVIVVASGILWMISQLNKVH